MMVDRYEGVLPWVLGSFPVSSIYIAQMTLFLQCLLLFVSNLGENVQINSSVATILVTHFLRLLKLIRT